MNVTVTMASWPPRIGYVERSMRSLLSQTRMPDRVELNLSRQEFPGGLDDLPEGLRGLVGEGKINLNWEDGNTYVFRKMVPTVKKYHGEDYVLLLVDDDCEYAPTYIEHIVRNLGDHDAYCSEPGVVGNRVAFRAKVFKPVFWEAITPEVVECGISDTWIGVYLQEAKADCRWERDTELDSKIRGIDGAATDHANSERIGGYTKERCELADRLSREALNGK